MLSLLTPKQTILLVSLLSLSANAFANPLRPRLDNGLALTPPMGWNTYNHYSCSPNETIVHSNAQALVDLGLQAQGYHFVTVDCGWTLPDRLANGTMTWNSAIFPSGFPALGIFVHNLGLGFGVYSDAGIQMCMTGTPAQVGSLFHEQQDATTFASWGADLLKYDNCYSEASADYPNTDYSPSVSPSGRYQNMSSALLATDRPIVFQICEWGVDFPSAWAPALGNSWRVTNDIIPAYRTIPRILNQVVPQTSFAGPGHWLDLDMLEVGNNVLTIPEEQTHFSLWAILKSPLVIGAALKDTTTSINTESLNILLNEDVIGYNQDSLGVAASFRRRWTEEGYEVWAGDLSGSRMVVAVANLQNTARSLTLNLTDVGVQTVGSLKDIWNGVTASNVATAYTGHVEAHGTILLELSSFTAAPAASTPTFYSSASFTPAGDAVRTTCSTGLCTPVGSKISYISPTGTASLSITAASAGSKLVDVYFCNNDIALSTSWLYGTNTRNLTIAVNDVVTRIEVPLSGKSSELFSPGLGWQDTGIFKVLIGGWQEGANTVVIGNQGGAAGYQSYGADFVGMGIYS
ncbi:putative alpha-galactosidase D [Lachnellula hyalina]|uniref:Alpha-galactosidase n=1 Tax=Lachnellula hyalina TaxID=1316788 RepID=A0A8H8QX54_9HELO|nr:putative alpha-galactosidase D [Lachnellula hyalina]TVY23780.1 putative alpha-galactosidase D [Lachnellula hyalina]